MICNTPHTTTKYNSDLAQAVFPHQVTALHLLEDRGKGGFQVVRMGGSSIWVRVCIGILGKRLLPTLSKKMEGGRLFVGFVGLVDGVGMKRFACLSSKGWGI
jgi:hypothetical protein